MATFHKFRASREGKLYQMLRELDNEEGNLENEEATSNQTTEDGNEQAPVSSTKKE